MASTSTTSQGPKSTTGRAETSHRTMRAPRRPRADPRGARGVGDAREHRDAPSRTADSPRRTRRSGAGRLGGALRIADLAGGDWPNARECSLGGSRGAEHGDVREGAATLRRTPSLRAREVRPDRLQRALDATLFDDDEAPWGDWDGRPLTTDGLRSSSALRDQTQGDPHRRSHSPRGFERAAFEDAWSRYLPGSQPLYPQQAQHRLG